MKNKKMSGKCLIELWLKFKERKFERNMENFSKKLKNKICSTVD